MLKNNWNLDEIKDLMASPVMDLLFRAQSQHRQHFPANQVQMSQLLSIKTGACPEDCSYCPQSGHYNTDLEKERLLDVDKVVEAARAAKAGGASRFCMGGAWRSPPAKAMPKIAEMIREVKALGMETCMTLGMLNEEQADDLKAAGLDYYNHNIDTSPEYYDKIIKTRTFQDRLDTLDRVRKANINVCCGGILGLGETRADRASFLQQLANMPQHPQSVTINRLIAIKGTPLEKQQELDSFEFIRTIASARVMMPKSMIRLSAGRESMSDELQTLCFLAGANSMFMGDVLLTAKNPGNDRDTQLMTKLGLTAMPAEAHAC